MPVVKMPDGVMVDLPEVMSENDMKLLDKLHNTASLSQPDEQLRVVDKVVRGGLTSLPRFLKSGADMAAEGDMQAQEHVPGFKLLTSGIRNSPFGRTAEMYKVLRQSGGDKIFDKVMTPSEPKSSEGKAIGNIGETIVGTLASPGGLKNLAQSLMIGTGSGVGGEIGERVLPGSPIGKIVGAILGGGVPAAVAAVKPNSTKLMREAVSEVPAAAWKDAEEMQATLKDHGINSIASQLLGNRSTLADLVSSAASRPSIRPKIIAATDAAPGQSAAAVENWMNAHLPTGLGETKGVLHDVQQAAEDKIASLVGKARGEYGAALPKGTSESTYSPEEVAKLSKLLKEASLEPSTFGPGTAGEGFLTTVAGKLDNLLENKSSILNAKGEQVTLPIPKGYVNNLLKDLNKIAVKEGYSGVALQEAKNALRAGTPEFQPARDAMSKIMEDEVNPAKKSLLGQLASMGGGVRPDKSTARTSALSLVLPKNESQPQAITQLGNDLGATGIGDLLRESLSREKNATFVKELSETQLAHQPFNFSQKVAGTQAQRDNLSAAIEASVKDIPGVRPAEIRNGFFKLLHALDSFKDLKIPDSIDKVALGQQASDNVLGKLTAPQTGVRRWRDFITSEKTFKEIADTVTDPNGIAILKKIANTQDPSIIGRYVTSLIPSLNTIQAAPPNQPSP